ncbi:MAG: trypsin-like peptidase domain-containing protein [Pirellulaceae bacterium]|nr:trypsin-like peptidase domain-containing protein [Pirellulaceae bacterium]
MSASEFGNRSAYVAITLIALVVAAVIVWPSAKPLGSLSQVPDAQPAQPESSPAKDAQDSQQPGQQSGQKPAPPSGVTGDEVPSAAEPLPSQETIRRLAQAAFVRIHHPRDGHIGCGVIISSSSASFDVLTAEHVIADNPGYFVIAAPTGDKVESAGSLGHYRECQTILRDSILDLALLRVTARDSGLTSIPLIAPGMENQADRLQAWIMTFTKPDKADIEQVSVGPRVRARRTAGDAPVSYWILDRPIVPGLSGSALLDSHGRLLGVASGNSRGKGYFGDERELATFLNRAGHPGHK